MYDLMRISPTSVRTFTLYFSSFFLDRILVTGWWVDCPAAIKLRWPGLWEPNSSGTIITIPIHNIPDPKATSPSNPAQSSQQWLGYSRHIHVPTLRARCHGKMCRQTHSLTHSWLCRHWHPSHLVKLNLSERWNSCRAMYVHVHALTRTCMLED